MTDGTPRFCQCGQPAGHTTVCSDTGTAAGLTPDDVERVDRGWENTEAVERAEHFERRKLGLDAERKQQRAEMTATQLFRHALERQAKISTVAAGNIEPSRGGSSSHSGPSRQQELDDDPRWDEHWDVIRSRLLRVHDLLDEAEGHGPVAATTKMLGEEKDRLILAEEGCPPLAVVEKLGREIAGSPETVRRVRRAAGRSAKDGHKITQPEPKGPVRRVRVDSPDVDS